MGLNGDRPNRGRRGAHTRDTGRKRPAQPTLGRGAGLPHPIATLAGTPAANGGGGGDGPESGAPSDTAPTASTSGIMGAGGAGARPSLGGAAGRGRTPENTKAPPRPPWPKRELRPPGAKAERFAGGARCGRAANLSHAGSRKSPKTRGDGADLGEGCTTEGNSSSSSELSPASAQNLEPREGADIRGEHGGGTGRACSGRPAALAEPLWSPPQSPGKTREPGPPPSIVDFSNRLLVFST